MSFFVKAVVHALKAVPALSVRIEGEELVENHYYDVSVAVGTEKGLVVPVLRDCDQSSFAEIEREIVGYAEKARSGTITLEDMQGGCFTITNGGIYGSMLSTPIPNPPQSGILGNAFDSREARGPEWRDRYPPDDVSCAFLRSQGG